MNTIVEFSVLSYYPSLVTDENINVAIAFNIKPQNKRIFYITNNWRRLESFDDELDISFMKKDLQGIRADFENSLFNDSAEFNFKEFIRFYVNELRFNPIESMRTEDPLAFIEYTKKVCMRFDFERSKRLGKNKEVSFVKQLMKQRDIKYQTKPISGAFEENVRFDFVLNDHGFKFFSFENKDLNRMIDSAKSWAFTAGSLKDKYKIVFVFDTEELDSSSFRAIRRILERDAKIVSGSQIISFVSGLSA